MNWLIEYAFHLVGVPYLFGGSTPMDGFDCSGLVCELMIASGEFPFNTRLNAQGLYDYFEKKGSIGTYGPGALAFYGSDVTHIEHVAFCLDSYLMVEAGGGDHTTTNLAQAETAKAFVKMRPIKYRKDFLLTVKPYYHAIGMI